MTFIRRKQWHPTPVLLPGKSHGRRSLEGCSPWGRWGSDMTERLHFHFSFSCIGEGNGNPLQCSCLENPPRDGGAWWAAVYGVTQSLKRLKWLSSSSNSITFIILRQCFFPLPTLFFIIKGYWIWPIPFLYQLGSLYAFPLYFLSVVYNIDWYLYIEWFLCPSYKSPLVVVYSSCVFFLTLLLG